MKIQIKKVELDDIVIMILEFVIAGIFIAVFGPLSMVFAYLFIAFFVKAAKRQGPIGALAIYGVTFYLFFGLMILWWYLVLSRVIGIPWFKEC